MSKQFSNISVIGLGYVGLPLSLQFARSGVSVLGFDLDQQKVDSINTGKTYLKHFPSEIITEQVDANRLEATTDPSRLSKVEAVLICVPTPLTKHREPDLSAIEMSGRAIAPYLQKGQLVVLESSTYPGTTAETLGPILGNSRSFLKVISDWRIYFFFNVITIEYFSKRERQAGNGRSLWIW